MLIQSVYDFGDIVYLKTDPEQIGRMITEITIYPMGILYSLSHGVNTTKHYELEFSKEKDVIQTL